MQRQPRLILCALALAFALPSVTEAAERRNAVVEVVERLSPAVVNISTEELVTQRANPFARGGGLFDEFFRNFFVPRRSERRVQELGTGVIIDPSGIVLTNEHVIARATNITVGLDDGREISAEVVAAEPRFDLAVLRLQDAGPYPYARMGRSDDLMPGETVVAIGNPFGLEHTVTTGVISATRRSIKADRRVYRDFIQTDASINPGNSGGPLLNVNGEVIGINTAIYAQGQGIGFAIPVDRARAVVQELLAFGKVRPAWLGIAVQDMDRELRRSFDYKGRAGVLVAQVDVGSPAHAAGFEPGDIIQSIDGKPLTGSVALLDLESRVTPGQRVSFAVVRDGQTQKRALVAAAFPTARAAELFRLRLGLELRAPNKREQRILKRRELGGLVVSAVQPRGAGARAGLEAGDLIVSIGGRKLRRDDDVAEAMARLRHASAIPMVVGRGAYLYRVSVQTR